MKKGSLIATALLYITLMMIVIIGVTSLVSSLLFANTLMINSMQANYSSKSALDLALYELQLHKEGYEQQRQYEYEDTIDLYYDTRYRSKHNEMEITSGIKKFALFADNGHSLLTPTGRISLTVQTPTHAPIPQCLELKLSGFNNTDTRYETIPFVIDCGNTKDIRNLTTESRFDVSTPTTTNITGDALLHTHSEVYGVARNISKDPATGNPYTLTLQLDTDTEIASFKKSITATGYFDNTVIHRKVEFDQDQIPEILSTAILHN